jgi:hypothetical protein
MAAPSSPGRLAAGCLGAALLLTLAGCGGGAKLTYVEVEGKVTLNEEPLGGVVVRFYPESEANNQLPYSTGKTDAAGRYKLTSVDGPAGAVVGRHRVVVSRPPRERPSDLDKPPPEETGPDIPVAYTVADKTPLVITVKSGDRQTIDLRLTD